ncbi:MAG TPA: adenylyltransferase/cytidyltransferase family protein [Victivallales bacterium]|nr:adenylyltransferase/cytidyltransferase family protein [Victivallales bacterium]
MNEQYVLNKIMSLNQARTWRNNLKDIGKKLVVTSGCFDIFHRGHATYLMKARALGDALLLGINSDRSVQTLKGPERPINKQDDRAFIMGCLPFIDAVVIFDSLRCDGLLEAIKPDIFAKGGDITIETLPKEEREILKACRCKIEFISFVKGFSSTSVIDKIKEK